ncbi:MAG: ABC transporter permease [Candidatus Pacearchaeota archaeon]|jgi:ABC-type multidrug transport system permease subunit
MASKLLKLIHKDFLILTHSKFSSLILFVGPILLILILGTFLSDNSIKNIQTGIYSDNKDTFYKNFTSKLSENSFSIYEESTLENCVRGVENSKYHLCIEITNENNSNTKVYTKESLEHNVVLYVDLSKQRIVWQIIGRVQGITEIESEGFRKQMISSVRNKLDNAISSSKKDVSEIEKIIDNLNLADSKISEAISSLNEIKLKADSVGVDLDNIDSLFSSLETTLRLAGINNTALLRNFSSAEQKFYLVNQKFKETRQMINDPSYSMNLYELQSKVRISKNDLIEINDEIKSVQRDLENFRNLDFDRLMNPISLSYTSILSGESGKTKKELGLLDYLFPSFIMIYVLFLSIILSSILIIRERVSTSYLRNILSRTSGFLFVFSKIALCFILMLTQCIILLVAASFFLEINLFSSLLSLSIILALAILVFTLVGTFIGYFFNSQESVSIASLCFGILFFVFSSLIIPKEMLPTFFSNIISLTPFVILETKLISVMMFSAHITFSLGEILSILLFSFIFCVLILFAYLKSKYIELK